MLPKSAFEALIPHRGAMALIDTVLQYDAQRIVCACHSHSDPAHPLRRDAQLSAVHLCEYGAQAMAVHGGLLAQQKGGRAQPGLLVALRDVQFSVARIDDLPGELIVTAEQLLDTGGSWQYAFRIEHQGRQLAAGRATVMLRQAGVANDE